MSEIETLLGSVPAWVWMGLGGLVGVGLLVLLWPRGPLGGIAALARNEHREANSHWFMSERMLCAHFYTAYHRYMHPDEFRKATSYLLKAEEFGRRELPWYGWVVVSLFLLVEAASFGLQLTTFVAPNGTTDQQTAIGYLLALVLAGLLLFLTHTTGRELHHHALLKKARSGFEKNPEDKEKLPVPLVSLDNDSSDDGQPPHIRLVARITHNNRLRPNPTLPIVAAALVLAIGGMQLYIRSQLIEDTAAQQTTENVGPAPAVGSAADDASILLPNVAQRHTAEEDRELYQHRRQATLAAFWMLFAIFLAMQLVGVVIGMKYGFSGRHSADAARKLKGFSDLDAYTRFYREKTDPIAQRAQSELLRLQHRMRSERKAEDFDRDIGQRTFLNYVKEEERQRGRPEEAPPREPAAAPLALAAPAGEAGEKKEEPLLEEGMKTGTGSGSVLPWRRP